MSKSESSAVTRGGPCAKSAGGGMLGRTKRGLKQEGEKDMLLDGSYEKRERQETIESLMRRPVSRLMFCSWLTMRKISGAA